MNKVATITDSIAVNGINVAILPTFATLLGCGSQSFLKSLAQSLSPTIFSFLLLGHEIDSKISKFFTVPKKYFSGKIQCFCAKWKIFL